MTSTSCRLRHIIPAAESDPGAVQAIGAWWRPDAEQAVNGRHGWIAATVERRLREEGKVTVRLPNTAGSDGREHRTRFAVIRNRDTYRIGEEWLEVWREAGKLMAVVTPVSYEISLTEIQLECYDALALTAMVRDETLHPWNAAPRDVLAYYSGLERPVAIRDFRGWTDTGDGTTDDGWSYQGAAPHPDGVRLEDPTLASVSFAGPEDLGSAWSATFLLRGITGQSTGDTDVSVDAGWARISLNFGTRTAQLFSAHSTPAKKVDIDLGVPLTVRLYRRGSWVYGQVNGETIAVVRHGGIDNAIWASAHDGAVAVVSHIAVSHVQPFLTHDDEPGDRHLPGAPTTGGLWGDYYSEVDSAADAAYDAAAFRARCLRPMREPYHSRVDPEIDFLSTTADPPAWQPPGPPGGQYFSVRWTGSIYLPLADDDLTCGTFSGLGDSIKVWIGKTGPDDPTYLERVGPGDTGGLSLRDHLGQQTTGWYPIVIEYTHTTGGHSGPKLYFAEPFEFVGDEHLSPYGVFTGEVQHESHREMLRQVTDTFGHQWTIEPRSLESGTFPGRLIPRVRQGRDTAEQITADNGTAIRVTGSAAEASDRLLIDAAGLARQDGADQITAEIWDLTRAGDRLFVATGYEQASDITETRLAEQRARSLLALRAGAAEQIEVQPDGARKLVDTWPLTGELARIEWEPGDGVRLHLPQVGVVDTTPRQLLGITWPARPDGIGEPQVTWRPRTAGARALLKRALRAATAPQRVYQGQLVESTGSMGGHSAAAVDQYSRLHAPAARVVRLTARVSYLTASGVLEVNGVAGPTIDTPGEYDVTHLLSVAPSAANIDAGNQYARITGGVSYQLQLTAVVRT